MRSEDESKGLVLQGLEERLARLLGSVQEN